MKQGEVQQSTYQSGTWPVSPLPKKTETKTNNIQSKKGHRIKKNVQEGDIGQNYCLYHLLPLSPNWE